MLAEEALGQVLTPLLREAGYQVVASTKLKKSTSSSVNAVDFVARKDGHGIDGTDDQIGIEFKYYSHAIQQAQVAQVLGTAMLQAFDRMILVSNSNFTAAARAAVEKSMPVRIELLGYDDLKSWASSLRTQPSDDELMANPSVRALVKTLSSQFARMIANNVHVLADLEWRQLEETMAEVFSGLGFSTTLTPGSKDGGKDLILEYRVAGAGLVFYVEMKHWRSATKVGSATIKDFFKVVVRDSTHGGLMLSTYGFTDNAFEGITEVERRKLHFGEKEKIVSLCQYYEKSKRGLWSPPADLGSLITDS